MTGLPWMPRLRRGACSLLPLVLLLTLVPTRAASAALGRIAVPGTVEPGRAESDRLGDAASGMRRSVAVSLPLRHRDELDGLITAVATPGSPQYGQYLTAAEFTDTFGPTPADVAAVSDHLRSQGLSVAPTAAGSTIVDATGTLADLGRAFGTSFGRYHDRRLGRDFVGNDTAASLPAEIASLVQGVSGLDDHHPSHHHVARSSATSLSGSGPGGGYAPVPLRTAYDTTPLGGDGTGQSIGLLELDGFSQSNVTTYDATFGLSPPAPAVHPVDGGSGSLGAGEIEVELDIEVIQAIAPAASITVYEGPNNDAGLIDTYQAMLTSASPVTSTSWGQCEPKTSPSTINALHSIFAADAAQGLSVFAASGDAGAYDCGDTSLAVDNPASDPDVTGVGGTSLTVGTSNAYASEAAWSNPSDKSFGVNGSGTGGGLSSVFAQPSWQSGPGVANSFSNGRRQVPDVAFDGSPSTGVSAYVTDRSGLFPSTGWVVLGGTSMGSPGWAGFAALYNQHAAPLCLPRLGFVSPTLYSLASSSVAFSPFHDVTTGDNLHYPATPGWDFATGLGSYDAYNIVRDLGLPPPPPTVSSVGPAQGTTAGGTIVTIRGAHLGCTSGVRFGATAAASFTVIDSATIQATSPPGAAVAVDITVTTPGGTSATSGGDSFTYVVPAAGSYQASQPTRICDTRPAGQQGVVANQCDTGSGSGAIGPNQSRAVQVCNGFGGAAACTLGTVVLNVTVVLPSDPSYLTVYPTSGTGSPPLAANLTYGPGDIRANLVTVKVGDNGMVSLYNQRGTVDVVVDLEGTMPSSGGPVTGSPGLFHPLPPIRICDTRAAGTGGAVANQCDQGGDHALQAGETRALPVTGQGGVPATGVSAVVVNATVTGTTAGSYLTGWPAGNPRPLAANINWGGGATVPNRVIVPVGHDGKVSFYNAAGSAELVVDVNGWYGDGSDGGGLRFTATSPTRICDTRAVNATLGVVANECDVSGASAIGSGGTLTVQATGTTPPAAPAGAAAVVANVTVTGTSNPSYLTVWPADASQPLAADLNWLGGQTVSNLVFVKVSGGASPGRVSLFNAAGTADATIDVAGYYS